MLGGIELRGHDGSALETLIAQPKRLALLAYLCIAAPNAFHRRDRLIATFWPHADEHHARGSLRRVIHALRRALGANLLLTRGTEEVAVNTAVIRSDVTALRAALAEERWEEALDLYRGELLDALFVTDAPDWERWLESQRDDLRSGAARAALSLAERYCRQQAFGRAAESARHALSLQPSEPALRLLMDARTLLGDRVGAIRAYEAFARYIDDEYGTVPSAETNAVLDRIRRPDNFPKRSLAVLPFTNGTNNPEYDYLIDGFTDQIIADLSRVPQLRVLARSTIYKLSRAPDPESLAASDLGIRYIVRGEIRIAGGAVRVHATVLDIAAKRQLWADSLMAPPDNILDLEPQIVEEVVRSLHLSPQHDSHPFRGAGGHDTRARDCYLRARYVMWRFSAEELGRAAGILEEGLRLVGENPLLLGALGRVHLMQLYSGASADPRHLQIARSCAERALALDGDCAPVYLLSALLCRMNGRPLEAIPHLKRALALDPRETDALGWLAHGYALAGQLDRARSLLSTLLDIDPLSGQNHALAGFIEAMSGRFAESVPWHEQAWKLEPEPSAKLGWAAMVARSGQSSAAGELFRDVASTATGNSAIRQMALLYGAAIAGDATTAHQAATPELCAASERSDYLAWELAACYGLLGDADRAVPWLRRAAEMGFVNYPFVNSLDPHLAPIRSDDQFKALMQDIKRQWESFES